MHFTGPVLPWPKEIRWRVEPVSGHFKTSTRLRLLPSSSSPLYRRTETGTWLPGSHKAKEQGEDSNLEDFSFHIFLLLLLKQISKHIFGSQSLLNDYREIRNNILFCVPHVAGKLTLTRGAGEAGT